MRNFATQSGKSKGQFYTPAEVSRVIAQIIGIREARTTNKTTVYDPTCGSGSLLLKVADEARAKITLYGQEKDAATAGLARMNMILHDNPTASIVQGNTLAHPQFKESGTLKTFDYVVANPPFSDKRWSNGVDRLNDPYERFNSFGTPPDKQGDYAYLLHIVRSLKSHGKGACILPHGVLFRGNAEADIRRNLIRKGYIKGIIGLPANLFYGTGIPACIIFIDKEDARSRRGIFMIDASAGFMKDGDKNRLRAMDIHRIVDVFNNLREIPEELLTGKRRLHGFADAVMGYKQTEVGVIPADWDQKTIGNIALKIGSGMTPRGGSRNYKEYGRPFVRSQNVGWGSFLLDDLVYIDDETHDSVSSTELKEDDVLLNITGASIGRSSLADVRLSGGNVNQHVCISQIKPESGCSEIH